MILLTAGTKPVLKAISKRENTLGSLFDKVDAARKEADKLEHAYTDGSTERKKPIIDGRESSLAEARKSSTHLIEVARTELADELSKVKAEIERESKRISDTLKGEVDKLSNGVAEKILKRSL